MIATYMLEYYRPLKQKPQQATMLRTQDDDHNKQIKTKCEVEDHLSEKYSNQALIRM